jgi:hypothetical protein
MEWLSRWLRKVVTSKPVFGVIVIVIVEQTATHACSLLLTCLHITCW